MSNNNNDDNNNNVMLMYNSNSNVNHPIYNNIILCSIAERDKCAQHSWARVLFDRGTCWVLPTCIFPNVYVSTLHQTCLRLQWAPPNYTINNTTNSLTTHTTTNYQGWTNLPEAISTRTQ